jgi:hypothetical protein
MMCFDLSYNFKWYFPLTHARDMVLVGDWFWSKIWFWPGIWLWPRSHNIRFCSHMIRFFSHRVDDIWLSPGMWYLTHTRDMILLSLRYDVTPSKIWDVRIQFCTHLGYSFVLSCGTIFCFHHISDLAPTRNMISYLAWIRLSSHSRYDLGLNMDMILLTQTCYGWEGVAIHS